MNQVILFYGLPASGKLTMANRLVADDAREGIYQTYLTDNHLFHDFVRPFIGKHDGAEEYWDSMRVIRQEFFQIIARFYPKDRPVRYISTAALVQNDRYMNEVNRYQDLAESICGEFIPIGLVPGLDVMKARCSSEDRVRRGKIHSVEKYTDIVNKDPNFKTPEFSHPNQLLIDNSNMTEDETFQKIKAHLAQDGQNMLMRAQAGSNEL